MNRLPALLALALAACAGPETVPTPTAIAPVQVVTTASAQPFLQPLLDRELTGPAPFIVTLAAPADLLASAGQGPAIGILLYLPEGAGLWATPLGAEPIAVIVNPASAAQGLTLAQLETIYTGRDPAWAPAAREDGDDSRRFFEAAALQGLKPAATARLAPTPAAMRQYVAATPNGLGYLPAHWLDASVRALPIEGKLPTEAGYPLIAQVVAVARHEPVGAGREWLGNIQKRAGP
jgi:hypothetical protein